MNADRTVLVVDDTPAHRYVMASWLRRAGFGVVEAGTGRDALAHATTPVDAVVLDVNLPDLSGREVCRILKSDPATAHLPVLHVSATDVDAAARTAAPPESRGLGEVYKSQASLNPRPLWPASTFIAPSR